MFYKFEERCKLGWKSAYAQIDWQRRHHRERLKKFVEAMPKKLMCQECGGSGTEEIDRIDGYSIKGDCGWCEGIGNVTRHSRGLWLRCKRDGRLA